MKQFSASGSKTPAFHSRTLRESGGIEGLPKARGSGEEAAGEDTKWAEGE